MAACLAYCVHISACAVLVSLLRPHLTIHALRVAEGVCTCVKRVCALLGRVSTQHAALVVASLALSVCEANQQQTMCNSNW
jgi:hypothetical protein